MNQHLLQNKKSQRKAWLTKNLIVYGSAITTKCNAAWPLSQTHTQSCKCTPITPTPASERTLQNESEINQVSVFSEMEGLQSKHAILLSEILNWRRYITQSFSENIAHSFSSVTHKVKTHMVYHFFFFSFGDALVFFAWLSVSSVVLPCHCQSPNPRFGTETACGGCVLCAS